MRFNSDQAAPLVWIGVGFIWMSFFLPALNRRENWAFVPIAIGLIPVVRGLWLAWQNRAG